MILEPIWEADFSQRSYGFRPNRSTYDAISYLSTRLASYTASTYQWVIEGDISSYFDPACWCLLQEPVRHAWGATALPA